MKTTNKKGFTIVELVIVIAVIAILAAVLIPTFGSVVRNANRTADMEEAKAAMVQLTSTLNANLAKKYYIIDATHGYQFTYTADGGLDTSDASVIELDLTDDKYTLCVGEKGDGTKATGLSGETVAKYYLAKDVTTSDFTYVNLSSYTEATIPAGQANAGTAIKVPDMAKKIVIFEITDSTSDDNPTPPVDDDNNG